MPIDQANWLTMKYEILQTYGVPLKNMVSKCHAKDCLSSKIAK